MVDFAANIWADGPSASPFQPDKGQIRSWGTWVEGILYAFMSGSGFIYASKASLTADLAKAANTMAWVIGDAVAGNNGIYRKSGASGSGSWVRVSDLPFSFIIASNAGSGTANAIQASSPLPVGGQALVIFNVTATNTGSPVTVSFNGGPTLTIKSNGGNNIVTGGLTAGMLVIGYVSGGTFRIITDQTSAALQSAVEAIAKTVYQRSLGQFATSVDADSYATSNTITKLQGTTYFNTTSSLWFYWDGAAWQAFPYSTIADGAFTAAKLPPVTDKVSLYAIRKRLRNMPDLGDYGIFSSGSVNYGQSDMAAAFAGVKADGFRKLFAPSGNYRWGEQIQLNDGITIEGENKSNSVFKFYHTGTGFVATGSNENGGGLKNLSIVNDVGALATAYIQLIASVDGTSPDFFIMEDLNLTCFGAGTVQYGIIANGLARDGSAPNALVGIRNLQFKSVDIFNCTVANLDLRHAKSPFLTGVAHYQAGGTVTKIIIGGSSTKQSNNVRVVASTLGDVAISDAYKVLMTGCDLNNVTLATSANTCRIANAFGTVSNNGAGCTVST